MTTRDDVLAYFRSAEPAELREVLSRLADVFSEKAEVIYDKNPEQNGLLAQPYADIADLVAEASMVFESVPAPVDVQAKATQTAAPTVSEVVAKTVKGNPWGGR